MSTRFILLLVLCTCLSFGLKSQKKSMLKCKQPGEPAKSTVELIKQSNSKRNTNNYNKSLRTSGLKKAKNASGGTLYKRKDRKIVKKPVIVDKQALFGTKKPEDEIK